MIRYYKQLQQRKQIAIQMTTPMNDEQSCKQQQIPQIQYKTSYFTLFIAAICQCFHHLKSANPLNLHPNQQTKSNIQYNTNSDHNPQQYIKKTSQTTCQFIGIDLDPQKTRKKIIGNTYHQQITQQNHEIGKPVNSVFKKWQQYPINKLQQNKFIIIGKNKFNILTKISTIKLQVKQSVKNLIKKSKFYQNNNNKKNTSNLDKYWNQRYLLFQKFDEGISMSQQMWPKVIHQAVSDYVSSKIKCNTVMNIFSGVGSDAIKLANTCTKVIALDPCQQNIKSIHINSKIYSTQQITTSKQTQNIKYEQLQPDIILISNYTKIQQDCLKSKSISPLSFKPNLKNIINKIIPFCQNFVIILPANININQLGQLLADVIIHNNIIVQTCSITIQKIIYAQQMKYIIAYFGVKANNEIPINDQLQFIYSLLAKDSTKIFPHKKLLKKLRQMYGMIKLLNLTLLTNKKSKQHSFQKFCQKIKKQNLLPADKLSKILQEQNNQLLKYQHQINNANGNFNDGSMQNQRERTVSCFSSIPEGIIRGSLEQKDLSIDNDPYKSITIRDSTLPNRSTNRQSSWKPPLAKRDTEEQSKRQNSDVQFFKIK